MAERKNITTEQLNELFLLYKNVTEFNAIVSGDAMIKSKFLKQVYEIIIGCMKATEHHAVQVQQQEELKGDGLT